MKKSNPIRARRIHGHKAMDYAYRHNVALHKYADPMEGARSGLRFDEAHDIAREDPNLIYVKVRGAHRAHAKHLRRATKTRRSR